MIHVTRASSLCKAICHALAAKGEGSTCGLLSAVFSLGEDSPPRAWPLQQEAGKRGNLGKQEPHTDSDRPCSPHLLPKHTRSHLRHMSVLGGPAETISSKLLISQTRTLRPRESTRCTQGHPASQHHWAGVPSTAPVLLSRCSQKFSITELIHNLLSVLDR